jgi:hypothetical protein
MKCLCLEARNHGWEQDATNCILRVTLLALEPFPVTAYWALPPSSAEYATIPRKDKRDVILCLLDESGSEAIFSTWVSPTVTTPSAPLWQLRIALASVLHVRVELFADNARTVYGDLFIDLSVNDHITARAVRWQTWR